MISNCLQKARDFEREHMKRIQDGERPCYHLTGGTGWINDPNGFSVYKGEYHLFYQYHPYSNEWGPMHWGHVKSRDLVLWDRLPIAMAPDEQYDKDGCFSGSALELGDGRHLLMFTGVENKKTDGIIKGFQTQCIAVGNGIDYVKYEGNPVITSKDLPEGVSAVDFRDPRIWQEEDGTFYAVVSGRDSDGNGVVFLFRSQDAMHWERCGEIDRSRGKLGSMWECPDFFSLDGKQVLLVSPMAMKPDGDKFHPGNGTACLIGTYDRESYRFVRQDVQPVDRGIDFYAPQTLLTPDGRRVMIGWMQSWSNSKFVPDGVKYFGQLTVPRELSVHEGRLIQKPVRELESYRGKAVRYSDIVVSDETELEGICGRILDMTVCVNTEESRGEFFIKVACNEEYETVICYDPYKETLCIDRSGSGYLCDIVHSRTFRVNPVKGELNLRILLDRYSIEIFVNGGIQTASLTIYTDQKAQGITFRSKEAAKISIEKYDLVF